MVTLKLVNGRSYSCPVAFGARVVYRNETVEVQEDQSEFLLEEYYMDASNNKHYYFEEYDPEQEDKTTDEPTRRSRRSVDKPRRTKKPVDTEDQE